ncbi:hypothetical protein HN682_09095, partial [Candidatus Peregrinibacteria bacterium]|nr:hypothetical protein [Candidatus Peregrinibacteria bacterium]
FVGRPGGFVLTSIRFTALRKYNSRERIATVKRSNTRIGIWQGSGDNSVRVRNEIVIPNTINPGSSVSIPIRFQLPREEGVYTVDIGDSTYILKAEGRRARSERSATSFQTFSTQTRENTQTPGYRRAQAREILQRERSPSATNTPTGSTASAPTKGIRIRLEFDGRNLQISNNEGVFYLNKEGSQCVLRKAGSIVQSGIVRIGTSGSINTISNWGSSFNKFRGVLECQVLNGELTIINELSLENYMAGLAEEPDTEHFQKQRAFSIAARSYAAFYMNAKGTNRKFQSMPYDGSDSPASFQIYRGYVFEKQNPSWAKAVRDTANKIITKNGEIVKAAYFSSSDGRTRSPAENGWNNFPFAEVFVSKPDPWCSGLPLRGHGVGMSGCGASAQAEEGKTAEEILRYYYTGTKIASLQH